MTTVVQRESVEKLQCTVEATADPTSGTNDWSFTTGTVRPTVWTAGSWGGATLVGTTWVAKAISPLVGTGGLDLTAGDYSTWVRVTTGSETPVMLAGQLSIA